MRWILDEDPLACAPWLRHGALAPAGNLRLKQIGLIFATGNGQYLQDVSGWAVLSSQCLLAADVQHNGLRSQRLIAQTRALLLLLVQRMIIPQQVTGMVGL